jgi:hypothetical protein
MKDSKIEIERQIRKQLEEAAKTLAKLKPNDTIDMKIYSTALQGYSSYLDSIAQERSLKQIRITAYATTILALSTLILSIVTWLHP